jgi:hypothetical protein
MKPNSNDPMANLGNSVKQTVEWATRIIAVCIFMGLIVWGGMKLDARFDSKWFTPVGLVLGIAFGMAGMILVVKRMEIAMQDEKYSKGKLPIDKDPGNTNSQSPASQPTQANKDPEA